MQAHQRGYVIEPRLVFWLAAFAGLLLATISWWLAPLPIVGVFTWFLVTDKLQERQTLRRARAELAELQAQGQRVDEVLEGSALLVAVDTEARRLRFFGALRREVAFRNVSAVDVHRGIFGATVRIRVGGTEQIALLPRRPRRPEDWKIRLESYLAAAPTER